MVTRARKQIGSLATASPSASTAVLDLGPGAVGRLGPSMPCPHPTGPPCIWLSQIPLLFFPFGGNLFFGGKTLAASPCFSEPLHLFLTLCLTWWARNLGKILWGASRTQCRVEEGEGQNRWGGGNHPDRRLKFLCWGEEEGWAQRVGWRPCHRKAGLLWRSCSHYRKFLVLHQHN